MVTSAAVIMVAVFSVFATLSGIDVKMLGVGLAAAVLIDATVVRGVILPAALAVLGERAWYLPPWLHWLPGKHLVEEAPAEPEPAESAEPAEREPAERGPPRAGGPPGAGPGHGARHGRRLARRRPWPRCRTRAGG